MLRQIIKEPLVHFLAVAVLFFIVYDWWNPADPDAYQITVTSGRLAQLEARFEKTWRRKPSADEREQIIRSYALDEIYSREARALGLDKQDAVIKKRLRQKLEFMVLDEAQQTPDQGTIEKFYTANSEQYRVEPRYSLEQVVLFVDREPDQLEALLTAQQERIAAGMVPVGDTSLLPARLESASASDLERQFGAGFSDALSDMSLHEWTGPVRSGIGLHFVRLLRKEPGGIPRFDDVAPRVLDDWLYQQSAATREAFEQEMLDRYEVIVESQLESAGMEQGS